MVRVSNPRHGLPTLQMPLRSSRLHGLDPPFLIELAERIALFVSDCPVEGRESSVSDALRGEACLLSEDIEIACAAGRLYSHIKSAPVLSTTLSVASPERREARSVGFPRRPVAMAII